MGTTDLIVPGDDSPYAVLRMPPTELRELIESNMSPGDSVGIGDLPRVKIPGAGGTTWEIPDVSGDISAKEIVGVIIQRGNRRAYYQKKFEGGNEAPDCASDDGIIGVPGAESEQPGPGGECALCPLNEFGSHENGNAKACKEYRQLFVLRPGKLLPLVINVTPGSLKAAKQYFFGLLDAGLKATDIETVLTLSKEKNATGIDYAQVQFRTGQRLDPEARARLAAYATLIAPAMERASREPIARDDLADAA